MQKVFFDTNIVIDFLGERPKFYEPAAKVLTLADKKKIKNALIPVMDAESFLQTLKR